MNDEEANTPTSGGVPVTDELIEDLSNEAEAGYGAESLRRRGGRKPIGSAAAQVVPVRLDPELKEALQRRADREHTSSSEVIRRALRAWLDVA